MPYAQTLEVLMHSILTGDAGPATGLLKPHPRLAATECLGIYSEGYRIRLARAVAADFPAFCGLLGEADAGRLISGFVEATPPTGHNLDFYPLGFPAFLAATQCPAQCPAPARALAELEGAIAEVFLAPGSPPLKAADLAGLALETLSQTRLHLRTSARLLAFDHDVESYLNASRQSESQTDAPGGGLVLLPRPIHLLLVRHENEVQRHRLEPWEYAMLKAIEDGASLTDALEEGYGASHEPPEQYLSRAAAALPRWAASGFFRQD